MRAFVVVVLVRCAGGGAAANKVSLTDASGGGDGAGQCDTTIDFDPAMPVAGDHVRATAMVTNAPAVIDYSWQVDGVPVTSYEAFDHSAIGYDVPTATSHTFTVEITGASCSQGFQKLNVGNPTGAIVDYRVRAVPPSSLAPPQDFVVQVQGGTNFDRSLPLDPGTDLIGFVKSGSTGVPAYLRFTPLIGPPVEAFSAADGSFETRLQLQMHTVLIVPTIAGFAPRLSAWTAGTTQLAIDSGTAVTGVVRDPGGAVLPGATVQLFSNGVPSTIATTAGDGSFTVQTTASAGAPVTVTVTPPATSGLARLSATAAYDLAQPIQISYTGSPASCDLAATPVKRGGANQAIAQVTIVGSIVGTFGTIATGGTSQPATGTVLVATTATGAGTLPSTLVPRAVLSAVVQLAPGDLAVATIDTSTCAAQTIDAPAMIAANGVTQDSQSNPISGVRVEATPTGVLAMANLVPVEAVSSTGGVFAIQLASGAQYDVRFSDPAGRVAPLLASSVTAAGVPSSAVLPKALAITGLVTVLGYSSAVLNTSVQILCGSCTGIDASRPIATTATDITSHYAIAVPDPGTM